MKRLYMEKKVSDTMRVSPGGGSLLIDVPFVPDYLKVKYLDTCTKEIPDELRYDLTFTGNPAVPYQLMVTWSVTSGRPRAFRYTVAKLASFHNGVNK